MNLWTRLGVSVALSAGFYIFMTEYLQKTAYFETHKWQCVIGLIGAGVFLWMTGQIFQGKPSSQPRGSASHTARYRAGGVWSDPAGSGQGFFSLRYCGLMLMLFGVITVVITPSTRATVVAATRHMTMGRTNRSPSKAPPTRTASRGSSRSGKRSDNALRLQGIIYRQSNPSAIINGQPIFIGEKIAGAKVVAITMNSVTLDVGGAEQVLPLRN
jgi:MSHA biogenesis protein MshK